MLGWLVVLGLAGLGVFWVLTRPDTALAALPAGDAEAGRTVFAAAGCASCHTAPEAETDAGDPPLLAGGQRFATAFGTFLAPNISSDPAAGIGAWTDDQVAVAVLRGVSRDGAHYYPVFPYGAYRHARPEDIADLIAYMRTLPASDAASPPHELSFPFDIRRGVGLWKLAFLRDGWVVEGDLDPAAERGRYLVEALGHCGECHTPRNALGGPERGRWLAGGPNPAGKGRIPGIDPGSLDWSENDIAAYLKTGLTPDYDAAGGEMAEVVRNTAQLTDDDRSAIASYLKVVPAQPAQEVGAD